jgi:hypothetical protein
MIWVATSDCCGLYRVDVLKLPGPPARVRECGDVLQDHVQQCLKGPQPAASVCVPAVSGTCLKLVGAALRCIAENEATSRSLVHRNSLPSAIVAAAPGLHTLPA